MPGKKLDHPKMLNVGWSDHAERHVGPQLDGLHLQHSRCDIFGLLHYPANPPLYKPHSTITRAENLIHLSLCSVIL